MLQTQVNYWTLMENKRHNLVSEDLGFKTLIETTRHNLVSEDIGWTNANESIRHNKASESLGWSNLAEENRHNLVSEGLSLGTLEETIRTHKVNEDIGYLNAASNASQAQASLLQAAEARNRNLISSTQMKNYYKYELPLQERSTAVSEFRAQTERMQYELSKNKLGIDAAKGFISLIPLIP